MNICGREKFHELKSQKKLNYVLAKSIFTVIYYYYYLEYCKPFKNSSIRTELIIVVIAIDALQQKPYAVSEQKHSVQQLMRYKHHIFA